MQQAILPRIIGAIGEPDFAAVAADAFGRYLQFDLAAVIVHRPAQRPAVMFDNFDSVGAREGIDNYVRYTHRINPMLAAAPAARACRARDFAAAVIEANDNVAARLVRDADEELGFRTVGWPRRMEEIDLYIQACGAVVELGFYRTRGRSVAPDRKLRMLNDLLPSFAAAFERHEALLAREAPLQMAILSPREREICALLLAGCSSHAIALRLDISRHTVKDHRKRIFSKLRIGSLAELFALHRRNH